MNKLKDKVTLVTGGSTGIGQATAIAFAQAGVKVAIASRSPAAGEETVNQIKAAGGDAVNSILTFFLGKTHKSISRNSGKQWMLTILH